MTIYAIFAPKSERLVVLTGGAKAIFVAAVADHRALPVPFTPEHRADTIGLLTAALSTIGLKGVF